MNNLYELINEFLAHKEEIVITDCDDPKAAVEKIICKRPELLVYIKSFSWTQTKKTTTVYVKYMNLSHPINKIYFVKENKIEDLLRQTVINYEKKVMVILSNLDNLMWILKCFMTKSMSFYPNLKSYAIKSYNFSDMSIPYIAYEIRFNYRIGIVKLKQMEIEVEKKVKEISERLFPFYMPDSVKCFIAHNYLASTIEYYNIDEGNPLEKSYVQSAYGALIIGKCVCQGYAEAYKRILNYVGIPCDLVSGKILDTDGEWHAWNIVHINKNKVHAHVDVTWDSHNKKVSTEYFGKGDEFFNNKRVWDRFYYCNCSKDNNILGEARCFCVTYRKKLIASGLQREWIE